MTQERTSSSPKRRLESLSDLIFGLALSIGALTLIGQAPSDLQSLLTSLIFYGFSFLILMRVWYAYSQIMADLHVETRRAVFTNIGLLFLVSIEPYLFNQLLTSKIPTEYVSIIYALDLGGLFAIQAFLTSSILSDKNQPANILYHYKLMTYTLVLSTAIFLFSILPFFWTLVIPINSNTEIPLRFILWTIPLLVIPVRRLFERNQK